MADEIMTAAEALEADAIPRVRSVHTDPKAKEACEQEPLPASVTKKPVNAKSPAEWAYERLIIYIKNFEELLDNEHEVAMGFTGAQAGTIRIEGMGYFDPDIITFYGSDDAGTRTQLIQHVSQLNVLLRALPKVNDDPPNRIGFRLVADLEASDQEAGKETTDA